MSKLVDWSPDSDYEQLKCNKTPEEWQEIMSRAIEKIIRNGGEE